MATTRHGYCSYVALPRPVPGLSDEDHEYVVLLECALKRGQALVLGLL
jgi:hypothetical protein